MRLQERSYSSKVFRPKPHIHIEGDGKLMIVATSWGQPEHAQLAAEEVAKYVTAARGDVEVTSPFEFMTSISDEANHLRIGLQIANDVLYRGENKAEYMSGIEILAMSRKESQIAWAQVGAPHLLLRRPGRPLVPLATCFDHSFELALRGQRSAPLPSRLLGVDPTCNVVCGDLLAGDDDLLVLLSSSVLPQSLWSAQGPLDVQNLTAHFIRENAESPFWLGLVDLKD